MSDDEKVCERCRQVPADVLLQTVVEPLTDTGKRIVEQAESRFAATFVCIRCLEEAGALLLDSEPKDRETIQ